MKFGIKQDKQGFNVTIRVVVNKGPVTHTHTHTHTHTLSDGSSHHWCYLK
jgi:hypothetical protein